MNYNLSIKTRDKIKKCVAYTFLFIVICWSLFPVFWAFETSLKDRFTAEAYPPTFVNFKVKWSNYLEIFRELHAEDYIINGLIAATGATFISLFFGVPHAYTVSLFKPKGGNLSIILILAARTIPPISIAVPFYILYNKLGLIDTKIGIILILTFLFEPFVVWVVKGFFDNLPKELEDSARIDGCTKFQAFYRVMLPLAAPGIAAATILSWLMSWNEFVLVFTLSLSRNSQTVPIGVLSFAMDTYTPWNWMMAAAIVGLIPSLLIVIAFQRLLVKGLTAGAMKA